MPRAAAEAGTAPEPLPAGLPVADAYSVTSQVVIAGASRPQWPACSPGSPRRTADAKQDAGSVGAGRSRSGCDSPDLGASRRPQAGISSI